MDCKDSWIDDSEDNIMVYEESLVWTPPREELLDLEALFEKNIFLADTAEGGAAR